MKYHDSFDVTLLFEIKDMPKLTKLVYLQPVKFLEISCEQTVTQTLVFSLDNLT